jgi:hypothetical protein
MTSTPITARNGVWTPWAQVLCVECDYVALKANMRTPAEHYAKHFQVVAAMDRTAEVGRPDGQLLGTCNTCHCSCWVRFDVALLQQVGFKTSELDWEGPFGWALEQTGGMCAALVFSTDDREIVVSAMDGTFFVGEYAVASEDDERWMDPIRTWQSETFDESSNLDSFDARGPLANFVDQCARQVINFVRRREVQA